MTRIMLNPVFRALGLVFFCAGLAAPVSASTGSASGICQQAAARASSTVGVPYEVLMALTLTETGRKREGSFSPWPWTMNVEGEGFWLNSRDEVLALAQRSLAAGKTSFDVGCFQINYRWHGENFSSIEEMSDPVRNALYAARFLSDLYQESGDWSVAAGAYHSRTPKYAQKYRRVFEAHLNGVGEIPIVPITRVNGYPLLQASTGTRTPGSLVPRSDGPTAGFFSDRTVRPFWPGS